MFTYTWNQNVVKRHACLCREILVSFETVKINLDGIKVDYEFKINENAFLNVQFT